jgi:hypothetical protein
MSFPRVLYALWMVDAVRPPEPERLAPHTHSSRIPYGYDTLALQAGGFSNNRSGQREARRAGFFEDSVVREWHFWSAMRATLELASESRPSVSVPE